MKKWIWWLSFLASGIVAGISLKPEVPFWATVIICPVCGFAAGIAVGQLLKREDKDE